jgi:hypothetical protein
MTVLVAILEAAGGAVREEDLAKVLETRFDLLAPPQFTPLYADEGILINPIADSAKDADPVAAETVAGEIWQAMSQQERRLLPHLDDEPREVANLLGLGRQQAAAIVDALREKLRLALTSDGCDQGDIVAALLRRGEAPLTSGE